MRQGKQEEGLMVSIISVVTWYIVCSKASVHHIVLFADQPFAEGGIKDRSSCH